ncbi:hypothetical protein KDH_00250 [Dictyobacter sp. S3.2.2.5]|uniref:Tyr recombinase domain-containing protein n=1 Tax=Dictyobacter halimunensis TaxID=3026934 RepID=A0ABQ6FGS0_9CHLR|nr:hypothetical protein KDH_00080 [Dictyobacter sp. S3.2.2.5]GLV53170.1 hypothetical protein KDH_00250 [Dictyobacter sp. S3.2.2.5]
MSPSSGAFRCISCPEGVTSRYQVVVVDGRGTPQYALTEFAFQMDRILSAGAARTYVRALLPYFTSLCGEESACSPGTSQESTWNREPEEVRESVRAYVVERLRCQARRLQGYEVIGLGPESASTVRVFLAALKHFYQLACRAGWYAYANPLTDTVSAVLHEVEAAENRATGRRPRMPALSGLELPRRRCCSENYFRVQEEQWVPQPIDDPGLPARLAQGMRACRWGLRDQIVVRLAYESGARIREVLCLRVGDWRARGCSQEATTCSKGSRGRRVKVIRFSAETARMLRAYVNTERCRWDGQWRRLEQLEDQDPLFVSQRGKPYDYEAFKPHWYTLCAKVEIDLNIHGLRHWYVTQAMRMVSESAQTPGEVQRGKEDLVRYMGWRSAQTLEAYEHYFQAERHARIQDQVYQRVAMATREAMQRSEEGIVPRARLLPEDGVVQDGWAMLLALGGAMGRTGGSGDATTTRES